ncbi:hypothetical protein SAMN04488564_106239 [Lentzea waywayandensis]|jgi:hypothetical protein|uniref:Uncharacterized protein n=1 Tax=Lentzea waywayandensis TaxID=84724 RepID=A0A1I6EXX7_9PSEU|nr:hypothetical protein [Lentzea waywayandensis]SFR22566.1 hypothetical protein SAMN04488564_106239 [Lentzea waywayandensis]
MTSPNQPSRLPQFPQNAGMPVAHPVPGVGPVIGQPVTPVQWFRRMPTGGTVYVKPAEGSQS